MTLVGSFSLAMTSIVLIVLRQCILLSFSLWSDILLACCGKCKLKTLQAGNNAEVGDRTWLFIVSANVHILHLLATTIQNQLILPEVQVLVKFNMKDRLHI